MGHHNFSQGQAFGPSFGGPGFGGSGFDAGQFGADQFGAREFGDRRGRTRGHGGHGPGHGGHGRGRGPRGGRGFDERDMRRHDRRGGPRGGGFGPELISAVLNAMEDGGVPPGFGFGGPQGRPRPDGGRRRARRGDVRTGILLLLAEEPRNGYAIIRELSERSGGAWNPSSGAVYPALNQLEDEGLIAPDAQAGPKHFTLTESGREEAQRLAASRAPWEGDESAQAESFGGPVKSMWTSYGQVAMALRAVMADGDANLVGQAGDELDALRRRLYGLLAGEGTFTEVEDDDPVGDRYDDPTSGAGEVGAGDEDARDADGDDSGRA